MRHAIWISLLGVLLGASPALAHGLPGGQAQKEPLWPLLWGALAALILLTLFLSRREATPAKTRQLLQTPGWASLPARAIGVGVFLFALYCGLFGGAFPEANLVTVLTFTWVWVLIPLLSLLCGDLFDLLSPWKNLALLVEKLTGRQGYLKPPSWTVTILPGALIAGFAAMLLFLEVPDRPQLIALIAGLYAALQFAAMVAFGTQRWQGDGLGEAMSFYASASPVKWQAGKMYLKRPAVEAGSNPAGPLMAIALLAVILSDSLSETRPWIENLRPGAGPVILLALILITLMLTGALILISQFDRSNLGQQAVKLSPLLAPMTLAMLAAHYLPTLLTDWPSWISLISNPSADTMNLFGTARVFIKPPLPSPVAAWAAQLTILTLGGAGSLIAARNLGGGKLTKALLVPLAALIVISLWAISSTGG